MLSALGGAMSWTFILPGLALSLMAAIVGRIRGARTADRGGQFTDAAENVEVPKSSTGSTVFCTAALLLFCAVVVYLPIPAISGRYTMPAVWGLDLGFAAFLTALVALPATACRQIALVSLVCGLIAVAAANLGRQAKFAARIDLLWQTLEFVERASPAEGQLAWISSASLNTEEGIHFRWHLLARGHERPEIRLIDESGRSQERRELAPAYGDAGLAISGAAQAPPGGPWTLNRAFHASYWLGRRQFDSYVWSKSDAHREASAKHH
jgi:hypothetical protein